MKLALLLVLACTVVGCGEKPEPVIEEFKPEKMSLPDPDMKSFMIPDGWTLHHNGKNYYWAGPKGESKKWHRRGGGASERRRLGLL